MKWFENPRSFLGPPNRILIAQLWVTSVAGTGLVLVLQTIGQDWPNYAWGGIDWVYTANRTLRYALICWFAAHLTVAYLLNEMLKDGRAGSLVYDVLQSIAGFLAFFSLGFVTQNLDAGPDFPRQDFSVAFAAISLIGIMAFIYNWPERTVAQFARLLVGAGAGGVSTFIQWGPLSEPGLCLLATAGVVACWGALILYWLVRTTEAPDGGAGTIKPLTIEDVRTLVKAEMPKPEQINKDELAAEIERRVVEKMRLELPGLVDAVVNKSGAPGK